MSDVDIDEVVALARLVVDGALTHAEARQALIALVDADDGDEP